MNHLQTLGVIVILLVLSSGCTSMVPAEGVAVNKYMVEPGYQSYYPQYYVVYLGDDGDKFVRTVNPNDYWDTELGHRYRWNPI